MQVNLIVRRGDLKNNQKSYISWCRFALKTNLKLDYYSELKVSSLKQSKATPQVEAGICQRYSQLF